MGGREEKLLALINEKCFCVLEVQALHKGAACSNSNENGEGDNEDNDGEGDNKNNDKDDDDDGDPVWPLTNIL